MIRKMLLALSIALLLTLPAISQSKPKMEDVAGRLACYCGTCPHLVVTKCGCSTADAIKKEIQQKIDSGMTEKQILDGYVAQHGQTVLAAPTKSGFNLTAWVVPFAAFALGGVALFTFLRRQQKDTGSTPDTTPPPSTGTNQINDAYREELKKELEKRQ